MNTTRERRLTRSATDKVAGGVAGGLGEFLGVDSTLVRLGFVAAALCGGSGFLIYLVMWLVVPGGD